MTLTASPLSMWFNNVVSFCQILNSYFKTMMRTNDDDIVNWTEYPHQYSESDYIRQVPVAVPSSSSSVTLAMPVPDGIGMDEEDPLQAALKVSVSRLDQEMVKAWNRAADTDGVLGYSVDNVFTKILPGKYGIVTQLVPNRAKMRRKPEPFDYVQEPFNDSKFNFSKILHKELLFNITVDQSCSGGGGGALEGSLIVNTAPICPTHCLLLPFPAALRPQLMEARGLHFALATVLLSGTRSFRVGLNSLCAFASVNHYHYHAYHLLQRLYVETAECVQLAGPCYTFTDYFAPGFVFQVTSDNLPQAVRDVMLLVNYLVSEGIPHNVFITRGAAVQPSPTAANTRLRSPDSGYPAAEGPGRSSLPTAARDASSTASIAAATVSAAVTAAAAGSPTSAATVTGGDFHSSSSPPSSPPTATVAIATVAAAVAAAATGSPTSTDSAVGGNIPSSFSAAPVASVAAATAAATIVAAAAASPSSATASEAATHGGAASGDVYDVVRLCVWPRKSVTGVKDICTFVAAMCELGGHVPVYDAEAFHEMEEETVIEVAREACISSYNCVLPKIKEIYSSEP